MPTHAPNRPLNLLLLHGYTQSGPLFSAKTGALRKTLLKTFPLSTLHYPTAPLHLSRTETPVSTPPAPDEEPDAWAWWRKTSEQAGYAGYEGLDTSLAYIAQILKERGPFDGILGFSQGAAFAALVASLLEPTRRAAFDMRSGGVEFPACFVDKDAQGRDVLIHPPLKFAVVYSGFVLGGAPYRPFYEPRMSTRVLHFLGMQDVVVEERRSLELVRACEGDEDRCVVYHPGGHFLPSTQKASVNALIGFIQEVMREEGESVKEEERVEDMHVPF